MAKLPNTAPGGEAAPAAVSGEKRILRETDRERSVPGIDLFSWPPLLLYFMTGTPTTQRHKPCT